MMPMKKAWLLFAIMSVALLSARAEILKGRVVDAETGEQLSGVRIEVTESASEKGNMSYTLTADTAGCFYCPMQAGNILAITAKYFGYGSEPVRRIGMSGNDTISPDTIYLRPGAELMREVAVDARMRRFYMRGDTVVFNPDAFNMEEGDRLVALIERLPGVSIRDGKLLWDGESLKMMMNGRDALDEAMLLNMVPVKAVESVQAYGRSGELQERTGVADGNEERVLDVRIKPGFMDRFHTEAQAKVYAGKEYAVNIDATKLSDTDPFMVYARVANDPERVDYRTINGRGFRQACLPIRQQVGAVAYRHLWKPGYEVKRDSRWDITAGANHWDETGEGWESMLAFVHDATPIRRMTTSRVYTHNLKVPLDFASYFNLGQRNTLTVDMNVAYARGRRDDFSELETMEAEGPGTEVNASTCNAMATTEGVNVKGNTRLTHYFKKSSVAAIVRVDYDNAKEEGWSQGEYQYFRHGTVITDSQRFSTPHHRLNATMGLDFNGATGKRTMFHGMWESSYIYSSLDDRRWRDGTPDLENSACRRDNNWDNSFTMESTYKKGRFSMKRSMRASIIRERTRYRRAALDTLATRTLALMRSFMEADYLLRPQMMLKGTLAFDNKPADIMDCIAYTDNTNPLYIRKGNPDLEKSYTVDIGLQFSMMRAKYSQALSFSFNYQRSIDPIATVLHYDSHVGAYTEQKRNVRGGDVWSARLSYECNPAKELMLSNVVSGTYDCRYGIMTIVDDATGMTYNRHGQSLLQDKLALMYTGGDWLAYSFHTFRWNRHSYSAPAQTTRNLFNYTTELRLRYKLGQWKFTLSPRYILDRGYDSAILNGSQVLLNAQVEFSFMKNRAELILYGHDLLNNQKHVYADITATTHTEGGERFLHQYATLTFRYMFNPKAKGGR